MPTVNKITLPLICVLAWALLGCGSQQDSEGSAPTGFGAPTDDLAAQELLDTAVRSEELIERLRATVNQLAFGVSNLELPDRRSREFFWLELSVEDLAPLPEEGGDGRLAALRIRTREWPASEARSVRVDELRLWRALLDDVDYFHNTKFKIKSGRYLEGEPQRFDTVVKFSALATMKSGEYAWVETKQHLVWRLLPGKDAARAESWRIESWDLDSAERVDAAALLFEDAIDYALPSHAERTRARHNEHERLVAERILAKRQGEEIELPHPLFVDVANDRQPGLAVVDLDRDGFDDLYLMSRLGKNRFYRNRGDGTFEEIAARLGIDVDSNSSAALFADFDNDGDLDLFLGRTEERSLYFENTPNEDGEARFVDRSSERVDSPLPYFASSVSASDYDGDGLLDLYVTTYSSLRSSAGMLDGYLWPHEIEELQRLAAERDDNVFLDATGPPNVLLHNEGGGRFHRVVDPGPLAAYRNSFQASWSDYDGDGDPDVYLSNDFSADALYRNEGGGRFSDVTEEAGITHFGLGMGASWGDYDRDGRQDVYATNMYSTAGTRITDQLDYLDPRIAESSSGNFLYRNEDGSRFTKVSSRKPPGLTVQETGWSWSSQFGDVDNDGFLDLAVLNGFYTAPKEVALAGDT